MKKLFALVNPRGKTKEQLVNEVWDSYQKYNKTKKKVLNPGNLIEDLTEQEQGTAFQILGTKIPSKMTRNKYIYIAVIVALALAGYFYFSKIDNTQDIESQQANTSIPVSPQELEELKKDPSAPAWLKDAESCTWIGKKIFCKLEGE